MGHVREGNAERGFTLVELMIVVVIIAILATIVIPTFMSEATKAKRSSEVTAMFTELGSKQEAFRAEQGKFMGSVSGVNYVGTTSCPATVPTADYNFASTCLTTGSAWLALRIDPPSSNNYCQYTITTGLAGTTLTPPTGFTNSQNAAAAEPALASSWYYLVATCDEKPGGNAATYYTSSVDRRTQVINEGQ